MSSIVPGTTTADVFLWWENKNKKWRLGEEARVSSRCANSPNTTHVCSQGSAATSLLRLRCDRVLKPPPPPPPPPAPSHCARVSQSRCRGSKLCSGHDGTSTERSRRARADAPGAQASGGMWSAVPLWPPGVMPSSVQPRCATMHVDGGRAARRRLIFFLPLLFQHCYFILSSIRFNEKCPTVGSIRSSSVSLTDNLKKDGDVCFQ